MPTLAKKSHNSNGPNRYIRSLILILIIANILFVHN